MMKSTNRTRVKAPVKSNFPPVSDDSVPESNEELTPNSPERVSSNRRNRKKHLLHPSQSQRFAQLNCRTLNTLCSREELIKHLNNYNIDVLFIQEHRFFHGPDDPEIKTHTLSNYTLFTASAWKNQVNATIGGVGIIIKNHLLSSLISIKKLNTRIVSASFKGNPKTYLISCYSPTNQSPDVEVIEFYDNLGTAALSIPNHGVLVIAGDFNAHLAGPFSLHPTNNRNGQYLDDFRQQFNLMAVNTFLQKPQRSLWTWRSPKNEVYQLDYILLRNRWKNSIIDCQAHSSSHPIGSDHRIVVLKFRLSLRTKRSKKKANLNWRGLADPEIAKKIDEEINHEWLLSTDQSYSCFVKICTGVANSSLPERTKARENYDTAKIREHRDDILQSKLPDINYHQQKLKNSYDVEYAAQVNQTLKQFDGGLSTDSLRNSWKLVKELSGKGRKSTIFIEGEDRLNKWKTHFESLLNAGDPNKPTPIIAPLFPTNNNIPSTDITMEEIAKALKQMKNNKAPGLDGLPIELWKLPGLQEILLSFCNDTYHGRRPEEWGRTAIVPVPKKGDLTKPDNYRGISLSQTAAKVYNRVILNRIRPELEKVLRPNQNGFRAGRSTSSQVLALRRIVEEMRNFNKEALILFIDFRKAFDSIDRITMFEILKAYGIPEPVVNGIRVMYENNKATVLTDEGESDLFEILTGILQGDPLAPYLFIIVLDFALRKSISQEDGITLLRQRSRRHPPTCLADLDFADDIALLSEISRDAEALLHKVESACEEVGLKLNAGKTKYIHLNKSTNQPIKSLDSTVIEEVKDFKYLGAYASTEKDLNTRKAQAWSAIHSLEKVWKADIPDQLKIKIFKMTVQSILLYSCESWSLTKSMEKSLDGTYTKMLRHVRNVKGQRITNRALYGNLKRISDEVRYRRLKLAGHVARGNQPVTLTLLWEPELKRKRGRPQKTLKMILEEDTGLSSQELKRLMMNRERWRSFITSPQ